jgi:hypothetical protein
VFTNQGISSTEIIIFMAKVEIISELESLEFNKDLLEVKL